MHVSNQFNYNSTLKTKPIPVRALLHRLLMTMHIAQEKHHNGGVMDRGSYLEARHVFKRYWKQRNKPGLMINRNY